MSRVKTPSPYSSKDTHSHDSGIGSIEKHGETIDPSDPDVEYSSFSTDLSIYKAQILGCLFTKRLQFFKVLKANAIKILLELFLDF